MRLTHLKLAGFKSFVDPTTLHVRGQRVGIVGPNGCGKSNVMEAIRWVLGESSAKEMRGDSMQDVIFNGSAERRPVSRASVELLFDNSLGAAAGAWAQYAEISVRRVLQRDGGSDYYLNNTRVRRRDIADLFLGTGLGGRAYAIIGQNTISRIVEARPEELRVFLEEAAGISRYKERRRETELRLRDARENLARVEDIRGELAKQIARLEAQAEVARHYHALQQKLEQVRAQAWLLKKRDAAQEWEKSRRQAERLAGELEAQVSRLRSIEAGLEQLRQQHHAAGDALHAAQGRYYGANAQMTAVSQRLQHTQETRERLQRQISLLEEEQQRGITLRQGHAQRLTELQGAHAAAMRAEQTVQVALQQARAAVPAAERLLRDAQASCGRIQAAIHQAEQQVQLERTHREHAARTLADIIQHLRRIEEEEGRLAPPDAELLQARERECAALAARVEETEAQLAQQADAELLQAQQLKAVQHEVQQAARHIAHLEAQLAALGKLQQALGHEQKLDGWLRGIGIDGGHRLWQWLCVEPGWETALESVLGNRLNGIPSEAATFPAQRPPASVVLFEPATPAPDAPVAGRRRLAGVVRTVDARCAGALADWLAGVHLLEDGEDPQAARLVLRPGEALVDRAGDVYTRHSVALYAAQSGLHGVLERQRELDQLAARLPELRLWQQAREAGLQQQEQALHTLRREIARQQHALRQLVANGHAQRLELLRLQQQALHVQERHRQLTDERERLRQRCALLEAQQEERAAAMQVLQEKLAAARRQLDDAAAVRQRAEATLHQTRERLLEAERDAQRAGYDEKLLLNGINELKLKIDSLHEGHDTVSARLTEVGLQLQAARTDTLQAELEQALGQQRVCEAALAAARNAQAEAEQRLQETERSRLQAEQQLHPLRDRLEEARLQDQQARLAFEHAVGQFAATGYDEAALAAELAQGVRPAALERQAVALDAQIAGLGPVNLAAIQELAGERERGNYLDSQAQDLETAIATLEDAIRRIDRETRSRLQHTFDEANRHFADLFGTLFGGGQAQLQLLGEEILDTGIQVFAQPPGKKNSTIHLLSGGEKALTALALVFALFRLNPAPFCLMDEVDAPLDDTNTERFCALVRKMSERTQFLFVSHNKITMEMAQQLVGVTMQESGVSRIVEVDIEAAMQMQTEMAL